MAVEAPERCGGWREERKARERERPRRRRAQRPLTSLGTVRGPRAADEKGSRESDGPTRPKYLRAGYTATRYNHRSETDGLPHDGDRSQINSSSSRRVSTTSWTRRSSLLRRGFLFARSICSTIETNVKFERPTESSRGEQRRATSTSGDEFRISHGEVTVRDPGRPPLYFYLDILSARI